MIEINTQHPVFSVLFAEDGKQGLSRGTECFEPEWWTKIPVASRLRLEGAEIYVCCCTVAGSKMVSVWIKAFGDEYGIIISVKAWDAATHDKVLDIKGHT